MKPPKWGTIDHEALVEIIEEEHLYGPKMYWQKGDEPPPWVPPTNFNLNHYRWAMIDFVEWHFYDRMPEVDLSTANTPDDDKSHFEWLTEWRENRGPEIVAAERGDILPLREKYLHLAKFLHIPERKRKRGQRITGGYVLSERVHRAADAVPEVKAIWEKYYDGKKVRRFEPSAEDVVAYIFSVEARDVKLRLNQIKAARHKAQKVEKFQRQKPKKPKKNK